MRSVPGAFLRWVVDSAKDAPTPLWVYAAAALATAPISIALNISAHPALTLGAAAFEFLLVVLVLRGSRVVWSLITASELTTLVILPFSPEPWWLIVLGVVNLICMLAPASRRYVWRARPAQGPHRKPQTTWDADWYPDSERPAGWYVDPGAPERMRYWRAGGAEWLGTTKTPRKISQTWRTREEN